MSLMCGGEGTSMSLVCEEGTSTCLSLLCGEGTCMSLV